MLNFRLLLFFGVLLLIIGAQPANGQVSLHCEDGSIEELKKSIKLHTDHTYRMERKFDDIFYYQGKISDEARVEVTIDDIEKFLRELKGREAAVLFYANSVRSGKHQLCSWLISADKDEPPVSDTNLMDSGGLQQLHSELIHLVEMRRDPSTARWKGTVKKMSDLLFPQSFAQAILDRKIDTLIVVPSSIFIKDGVDISRALNLVCAVGRMPFSLLMVGNKKVVDVASVVIVPGFTQFKKMPRVHDGSFAAPVVVADPTDYHKEARKGAEDLAKILKTKALIGKKEAKREEVLSLLKDRASVTGLIYFATHASADAKNPLDGSYLELSDGWLTARKISELRFCRKPLVVMNACKTGLGREFAVGTIGLARAWHWAGASNVVMSVCTVYDVRGEGKFMTDFIKRAAKEPADKALQKVMQAARAEKDSSAYWASFTVFGMPEIERGVLLNP